MVNKNFQNICLSPLFIIVRFASITLNLGPTFLSGTMAANMNQRVRWDLLTKPRNHLKKTDSGFLIGCCPVVFLLYCIVVLNLLIVYSSIYLFV